MERVARVVKELSRASEKAKGEVSIICAARCRADVTCEWRGVKKVERTFRPVKFAVA